MKKIIALTLAVCMLLTLAACASKEPAPTGTAKPSENGAPAKEDEAKEKTGDTEKVEITFATSLYIEENHQITLDALLDAYNKKNPNVIVTIYGADYNNFWNNVTTEIISGQEADIIQITPDTLSSYYALRSGGAFEPLDDYMAKSGIDYSNILTGQTDAVIDGKNVALASYAWGTTGIFYRKSILEKYGINPEEIIDSDDFVRALRTVTEGDNVGMGVVVGTHNFVYREWMRFFSHALGGFYFEEEKGPYDADHLIANNEKNVYMAEWWQNLILNEKVFKAGPDKKDARELFWNGLAAFNVDGPWFIGMTEARDPAILEDTGLIPHVEMVYEGKNYKARPTYSPYLSCISSASEHKEEAWDFISWMASEEAQRIVATCGMTPCNKEYAETDEYKAQYPLAAMFGEFMVNNYGELMPMPTTEKFNELDQVMIDAAQEMFSEKGADVKTTLDAAVIKMQEVMNK